MLQVMHLQKPSPGQPRAKAELSGKHTLPWMDQGQRYGSAEGSVPFATALVPSPFLGRRPAPQPHSSSRFLSRFPLLGHRPPKKTLPYLISNSFLFVLFRNWHPNIPGCVSSHGHFFLGPFCSLSEDTLVPYADLCSPGCPAAHFSRCALVQCSSYCRLNLSSCFCLRAFVPTHLWSRLLLSGSEGFPNNPSSCISTASAREAFSVHLIEQSSCLYFPIHICS